MKVIPIFHGSTPPTQCPECAEPLNGFTGTTVPVPGDITMCVFCKAFLVFQRDYSLSKMTEAEWSALPIDQKEALIFSRAHWKPVTPKTP